MLSIFTTNSFDSWFAGLRDQQGKRRIQARIDRMEDGYFGDVKAVGQGVSELRIHCGPGYRVYVAQRGAEYVVLLAGGDKSSQQSDIETAITLAKQISLKDLTAKDAAP